jgi:hypothetical protein
MLPLLPLLAVILLAACEQRKDADEGPPKSATPPADVEGEGSDGPADAHHPDNNPDDQATTPTPADEASHPPTPQTPSPDPASTAPADLSDELASVEQRVERAEFREAYQAARALQRQYHDHPRRREIDKLVARMSRLNRQARGMDLLIDKLDAPDARTRHLARRKILEAGEVGDIALRHVVRTREDATAVQAARVLIETADREAGPLFARRLADGVEGPLRATLIEGLPRVAPNADPRVLQPLYPIIQGHKAYDHRRIAGYVIDATAEAAEQAPARWAQLLGDEDAYPTLRGALQHAITQTDQPDLLAWAADHAMAMDLMQPGLRAEFFKGTNLDDKIGSRLVKRINVSRDDNPIEGIPTSSISARWTGRLLVPRDGKYTLYASSDDGVRLWVDGERLIDHWRGRAEAENSATLTLEPGLHTLKMEWFQGGGGYACRLRWAGPEIDKQYIGPDHLRVDPWPGMDRDLED